MSIRELQSKFKSNILKQVEIDEIKYIINAFTRSNIISAMEIKNIIDGSDNDGIAFTCLLSFCGELCIDPIEIIKDNLNLSDDLDILVVTDYPIKLSKNIEVCQVDSLPDKTFDMVVSLYNSHNGYPIRKSFENIFDLSSNVVVVDYHIDVSKVNEVDLYLKMINCFKSDLHRDPVLEDKFSIIDNIASRMDFKRVAKNMIKLFNTYISIYTKD